MTWIDLSMKLSEDLPIFPGDTQLSIKELERSPEGYADHDIKIGFHTGTHIDSPYHVLEEGKRLVDFPIERFQGRGVLIDCKNNKEIKEEHVQDVDFDKSSIVLLHTDWSKNVSEENYYTENPHLTERAARVLVEKGAMIVGIDSPNVDALGKIEAHRVLLGADVLILENLVNLDQLIEKSFELFAFPLRVDKVGGSPCRAVAKILNTAKKL